MYRNVEFIADVVVTFLVMHFYHFYSNCAFHDFIIVHFFKGTMEIYVK